jgi:hypothetical protein
MADYYPLLARAIGGLPDKSEAGRKVVYERARRALLTQLRGAEPPLRPEDIAREQQSLEEAVLRLERDYGDAPEARPEAEPYVAPAPFVPQEPEAAPPAPVPPRAEPQPDAPEPAPRAADRPAVRDDDDDYVSGLSISPPEREPWPGVGGRLSSSDDFAALRRGTDTETETGFEPGQSGEPQAPTTDEPARSGGRGRLIGIAALALLLVAGVAVGFTQRATIVGWMNGLSSPAPQAARPTASAQPEVSKSTDRIAQAPADAGATIGTPAQVPAAAQGQAQNLDVAQRAVLFEESAGGGDQGLQQYVGNVLWSTETFRPSTGGEPDIGIRAVVTIPDRNIKVTLRLRRNQDPSIPASHIAEVQFDLPPNFDLGAASNVPGMRAKSSEGAQGVPLTGLAVRVAPGYFLIGLSALDADRQRNLSLLITRNFLDIPVVFENGRRAILVLDKGVPGDQAFRQAFMSWGLPVPNQIQPQP